MTLTVRRLNYQLSPSEEKMKPSAHIWMERLRAKYYRPHLKNERVRPRAHLRSSHYIGEIVKVGVLAVGAKMVSNQPRMVSNVVTT